jgi:hypothetical protein
MTPAVVHVTVRQPQRGSWYSPLFHAGGGLEICSRSHAGDALAGPDAAGVLAA